VAEAELPDAVVVFDADFDADATWVAAMHPARDTAVPALTMPVMTRARWAGWRGRREGLVGFIPGMLGPPPQRILGGNWDHPPNGALRCRS
jgi:hypothetical protein